MPTLPMPTLPMMENAERLGHLCWVLEEVASCAGRLTRAELHDRPVDARILGTWSSALAVHAAAVGGRIPLVGGLGRTAVVRPDADGAALVSHLPQTTSGAVEVLRRTLAAIAGQVADHRRAVHPTIDGPTARLLDRLVDDLDRLRAVPGDAR